MKWLDKIKEDISSTTSPVEMAGVLDGIKAAAQIYCARNCPSEIEYDGGRMYDVTIYGMIEFLESDVD